jgi:hypothetical protein
MNKFWDWMVEMGYCKIRETQEGLRYRFLGHGKYISNISVHPQMLIGYKLKYIFDIGCSTWLKPCSTFEEYCNLLDSIIEGAIKEIK